MSKVGRKPRDWSVEKVGRLQPLFDSGQRQRMGHVIWWCKCDCGNIVKISAKSLGCGTLKSCGCWKRERWLTHGGSATRLYYTWACMKGRCYNPNDSKYRRYGKRGIDVCDEWKNNFEVFRDWALSHGYKNNLTIDKIDNDKGYSPNNCQWLTNQENSKKYREVDKWKEK